MIIRFGSTRVRNWWVETSTRQVLKGLIGDERWYRWFRNW